MTENHSKYKYGRKFWYRLLAFLLFFFMLCWIICQLNVLTEKVDDKVCCDTPCPSQINAVCVDTLITTKRDSLDPKNIVSDTIFQKYYCSQIVVTGIDDENESDLDSLLNNGFEVVRSCACDSIRVFGRSTPLTPEERVRTSEGDLVDESGGLGTGMNFIIDLPIPSYLSSINIPVEGDIRPDTITGIPSSWLIPNSPSSDTIKVAIIDTGIDFKHPNLSAYRWGNKEEISGKLGVDDGDRNCLKDDKFGYNFADDSPVANDEHGHGTHVAGIISQSLDVELMNLKIFNKEGSDAFSLTCALQYAVHEEADIINLSLGYYSRDTSAILDSMFQKVKNAGILVVTSAGNEGRDNDNFTIDGDTVYHFPSSFNQMYDNIMAVAALNKDTTDLWKYSNYGKVHVDVAAIGENVTSTYIDPLEEFMGDPFISLNGTSMAAAKVSAEAVKQMLSNPSLTKNDILIGASIDTLSIPIKGKKIIRK